MFISSYIYALKIAKYSKDAISYFLESSLYRLVIFWHFAFYVYTCICIAKMQCRLHGTLLSVRVVFFVRLVKLINTHLRTEFIVLFDLRLCFIIFFFVNELL